MFVYACTVLYVLQSPLKCCVYTSTCIQEAVVMSIECEFLWYSNNDIMVSSRPPACKLGGYPDQKQDYHLEWPKLNTYKLVCRVGALPVLVAHLLVCES